MAPFGGPPNANVQIFLSKFFYYKITCFYYPFFYLKTLSPFRFLFCYFCYGSINCYFLLCKYPTDPFDCSDCHLVWLIRDNRHLLAAVYGATCSNGTVFKDLDPNGYADCPVIIACPPHWGNECLFIITQQFYIAPIVDILMLSTIFTNCTHSPVHLVTTVHSPIL